MNTPTIWRLTDDLSYIEKVPAIKKPQPVPVVYPLRHYKKNHYHASHPFSSAEEEYNHDCNLYEQWQEKNEQYLDYMMNFKDKIFPASGFSTEQVGRDLVEGRDFAFQKQGQIYVEDKATWAFLSDDDLKGFHTDDRRIVAIPITDTGDKPDCSQHKKEVAGISDMKVLAEMIGDLHYETLTTLLYDLSKKINADGEGDYKIGRKKLAGSLQYLAQSLFESALRAEMLYKISKPFMENKTQD